MISNTVDDYFQGQIASNQKLKSVQSMQVLLVALEHSISFATYLAANFGYNRFRAMPEILSKLFCITICSDCAFLLESEQKPFARTGS